MPESGRSAAGSLLKNYEQLTRRGRLRRLRGLALGALEHYGLKVAGCALVATDTNLIYRVAAADGSTYALRIATPNWRTETDLRSETLWLEALAADTTIGSPRVMRAADGSPLVRVGTPGIPGYPAGPAHVLAPGPGALEPNLGGDLKPTGFIGDVLV